MESQAETLKKYTCYQEDADYYKKSGAFLELEGHQLLDACSSGIEPFHKYSQNFSENTSDDIKEIVTLIPESPSFKPQSEQMRKFL